jgi:hypothetical protein
MLNFEISKSPVSLKILSLVDELSFFGDFFLEFDLLKLTVAVVLIMFSVRDTSLLKNVKFCKNLIMKIIIFFTLGIGTLFFSSANFWILSKSSAT